MVEFKETANLEQHPAWNHTGEMNIPPGAYENRVAASKRGVLD